MKRSLWAALGLGLAMPLVLLSVRVRFWPAEPVQTAPVETESISAEPVRMLNICQKNGTVVQMELEEYLVGVVLAEMPASFAPEALKAQAVVARTYTCKRLAAPRHEGAAVCMDPECCQAYVSPEDYVAQMGGSRDRKKIAAAVEQTRGLVLTYDGELIDATYFSCSGGSTEDAVAVWGRDVPYLQAVESPGEESAPRYSDSVTFSSEQFQALTGCGTGDPADWFGAVTYTGGGGVAEMEICGQIFTGVELRRLLGLRSTIFSVSVEGDAITFATRGFGHRVGMSQYGAQAMALGGSDYIQILTHYYRGAVVGMLE